MSTVYLLTGSNLGDSHQLLAQALTEVERMVGTVTAASRLVQTPPWGFDHPNDFLNQALRVETVLEPHGVLKRVLHIEQQMGRIRSSEPGYQARTLDIDLLLWDETTVESLDLTIPHPHLHTRGFALAPLAEIAPEVLHPVLQRTIAELWADCADPTVKFVPGNHVPA